MFPTPENLVEATWLIIGFLAGRCFGKQFDHMVQQTSWYKKQGMLAKWFIKALLNFTHHFWIGLLLMCYADRLPFLSTEIYWFGYGLFLDDLPDIPSRFRKYFRVIT